MYMGQSMENVLFSKQTTCDQNVLRTDYLVKPLKKTEPAKKV